MHTFHRSRCGSAARLLTDIWMRLDVRERRQPIRVSKRKVSTVIRLHLRARIAYSLSKRSAILDRLHISSMYAARIRSMLSNKQPLLVPLQVRPYVRTIRNMS